MDPDRAPLGGALAHLVSQSHLLTMIVCVSKLGIAKSFVEDRPARFGLQNHNPEEQDVPFWHAMIREKVSPSDLNRVVNQELGEDANTYWATWTMEGRTGQTTTVLPDGRVVRIGGTFDDPRNNDDDDDCNTNWKYNDVFVENTDGTFKLYGYPSNIFPPTTRHTATLVGNYIYIIGNSEINHSPYAPKPQVYRLDTNTFSIDMLETSGDSPGFIYNHLAINPSPHQIAVYRGIQVIQGQGGKVQDMKRQEGLYILNVSMGVWMFVDPEAVAISPIPVEAGDS